MFAQKVKVFFSQSIWIWISFLEKQLAVFTKLRIETTRNNMAKQNYQFNQTGFFIRKKANLQI